MGPKKRPLSPENLTADSASPAKRTKEDESEEVEESMDAVCGSVHKIHLVQICFYDTTLNYIIITIIIFIRSPDYMFKKKLW